MSEPKIETWYHVHFNGPVENAITAVEVVVKSTDLGWKFAGCIKVRHHASVDFHYAPDQSPTHEYVPTYKKAVESLRSHCDQKLTDAAIVFERATEKRRDFERWIAENSEAPIFPVDNDNRPEFQSPNA